MEEEHSLDFFFKKLEENEKASGKQRWNEICKDLCMVYEDRFTPQERLVSNEQLWQIFFKPNKESFLPLFKNKEHAIFFSTVLYPLLDDPSDWNYYLNIG